MTLHRKWEWSTRLNRWIVARVFLSIADMGKRFPGRAGVWFTPSQLMGSPEFILVAPFPSLDDSYCWGTHSESVQERDERYRQIIEGPGELLPAYRRFPATQTTGLFAQ